MISYNISSLKLLVTASYPASLQCQSASKVNHLIVLRVAVFIVILPLHIWQTLFMIDIMLINVLQLPGMCIDRFELLCLLTLHNA